MKKATLSWSGSVVCTDNGMILPDDADKIINKKYWYDKNGKLLGWPVDQETGIKLSIYRHKECDKHPSKWRIKWLRIIIKINKFFRKRRGV